MAGSKTHEQQQRIINKQEQTKGVETPVDQTLDEGRRRNPAPPAAYDNRTGDRSIKHGSNQESEHHKERTGE